MSVDFCGLKFSGLKKAEVLNTVTGPCKFVVTVNAEFIVEAHKDNKFKRIINDNVATFDGQIPYLCARMLNPSMSFEKISGSDLLLDVVALCAASGDTLFFLGADAEVNLAAVQKAKEMGADRTFGYSPPFCQYPFPQEFNDKILEQVLIARPKYLFVGFGAKKQEFWINDHYQTLESAGVRFVVGTGGAFAFLAGSIRRAPKWIQRSGLEGVYRFFQEPKFFRLVRLLKSFKMFRHIFK